MSMNRRWLERVMEDRGITYYALKNEFHFSPDTFKAWEAGQLARPHSMRKLADILDVPYPDLVKGLGVEIVKPVPPKSTQFKREKVKR